MIWETKIFACNIETYLQICRISTYPTTYPPPLRVESSRKRGGGLSTWVQFGKSEHLIPSTIWQLKLDPSTIWEPIWPKYDPRPRAHLIQVQSELKLDPSTIWESSQILGPLFDRFPLQISDFGGPKLRFFSPAAGSNFRFHIDRRRCGYSWIENAL